MSIERALEQIQKERSLSQGEGSQAQESSMDTGAASIKPERMAEIMSTYRNNRTAITVDTSALSSFQKSFAQSDTFSYNTAVALAPKLDDMEVFDTDDGSYGSFFKDYMFGELRWRDDKGNLQFPKVVPATELYGEDFFEVDDDTQRKRILQSKADTMKQYYAGVAEGGASSVTGTILGTVADPSTAIPLGGTMTKAVAAGGVVGGVDAVAYDLAQKGKLDAQDVVLGTTLGAIASPLLLYGQRMFTSFLRGLAEDGTEITADMVANEVKKYDMPASDIPDPIKLAAHINEKFELKPKGFLEKSIKEANRASTGQPLEMPLDYTLFNQRLAALSDDVKLDPEDAVKAIQVEESWKTLNNGSDLFPSEQRIQKDLLESKIKLKKENQALSHKTPTPVNSEMAIAMQKALDKSGQSVDDFQTVVQASKSFSEIPVMKELTDTSIGGTTGYSFAGEGGEVFGKLAADQVPYSSELAEKTIRKIGMLENINEPITPLKADKIIKDFSEARFTSKPETAFKTQGTFGREFAERFKRSVEDMNISVVDGITEVTKAFYQSGIKKKVGAFTKTMPAYNQIADVLRGTIRAADADPMALQSARAFRKVMNKGLDSAVENGVMTAKKAKELKAIAAKEGYYPRIYNQMYLNSKGGKQKWIETFTKRSWSQDEVEGLIKMFDEMPSLKKSKDSGVKLHSNALNTLEKVSNNQTMKRAFLEGMFVRNGGVYRMPAEMAEMVWEQQRLAQTSSRSTHLENSRKINLPDDVLKPFLIDDPITVLSEYLRDVHKRSATAKWFGAKDQKALELFNGVEGTVSPQAKTDMMEVYYTHLGDATASQTIKKYVNMPSTMKSGYGSVTALETLKLIFAPINNSVQATVNGLTALQSMSGSTSQTMKAYARGLRSTFTKEGRDIARRSGAAAESTLIQAMGDITSAQHSVVHKDFKGVFTPLNYLNQPTKYLQAIGFTKVEEMQRILAANMGRAWIEDMIETNAKLVAKKASKTKISKKEAYRLDKNRAALAELGIDPTADGNQIVGEVLRGAQRFSNEINFINTADQMPIALQNPYVKPLLQFKSFVIKHTAFLNKHVLTPLRKNKDPRPLFMYLGVGTPVGMGINEARKFLMADDSEYTMTEEALKGTLSVGGLGVFLDAAHNASYSDTGFISYLAGPALGDISSWLYGGIKSVKEGSPAPLAKEVMSGFPFPGRKKIMKDLYGKDSGSSYSSYYGDFYGDTNGD